MKKIIDILDRINQSQMETFVELEKFREKAFTKTLPTGQRGLYWLWTNLDYAELESQTKPNSNEEVPITQLVSQRKGLSKICNLEKEGYRVVYNGIGGYRKPGSFGLRERINQEVIGNGATVGTLNILQNSDITRWAVSYFNFDAPENKEIIEMLDTPEPYIKCGKDLETLWRLEYGTPILCRH